MMDGTWLDSEWYELCDTLHSFKELLWRRCISVVERKGYNGGGMRTVPRYCITIRRDASDAQKLFYLIHEFVHFELGHRDIHAESYATEEVEAYMVGHIVSYMFYLGDEHQDGIYIHSFWLPGIYRKAYSIASQLLSIFPRGRIPANHNALMS